MILLVQPRFKFFFPDGIDLFQLMPHLFAAGDVFFRGRKDTHRNRLHRFPEDCGNFVIRQVLPVSFSAGCFVDFGDLIAGDVGRQRPVEIIVLDFPEPDIFEYIVQKLGRVV